LAKRTHEGVRFCLYQEVTGRMDLTRHLEQLVPATSETAYDRLSGYGFARRYVTGKIVADIGWDEVGLGSRMLAETAESVTGLANSTEAVDLARSAHPAPNAEYRKVDLPELPYPDGHFDVVVALGVVENLEQPENLMREASRVLKQDGVLIISSLDKLAFGDGYDPRGTGYRRGMYAAEFQELLEAHFGHVLLYRQGAVAGGSVFPISGEVAGPSVESTTLNLSSPHVGEEPPATRSVMAVCGNGEGLGQEKPYLLLDRDRRVFDECEDRAGDVELLRGEIRQMQETEAQAFLDALRLRGTEIGYLRARIRNSDAQIHGLKNQIQGLKNQIRDMENSTTWRIFEPYRRLRARMGAASGPPKGSSGESGDRSG
jgi:2-polyprenyl-3-methyl-5-hydroxy-6-metoxy-1,4-benzoquinol methylase